MPYTDDELSAIYGGLGSQTSTPQADDTPWKTTKEIANIIPSIGNRLANSITGIAQMVNPDYALPEYHDMLKDPLPTFDVGQNKNLGDVALNTIVPEIGSWLVPYTAVGKAARVAMGAEEAATMGGKILTEGFSQGAANALSAVREPDSTEGPLDAGATGFLSGALQTALPRWQRALPLAAVSALDYAKTGNATGAIGNFMGNMLPGAAKSEIEAITKPRFNVSPYEDIANAINPRKPPLALGNGNRAQFALPYSSEPNFTTGSDVIEGAATRIPNDPAAQRINLAPANPNAPALEYANPPNFQMFDSAMSQPSGLRLASDTKGTNLSPIAEQTPNAIEPSGLRLETPPHTTLDQPEFPLIKLQSEQTYNPDIKFTLQPEGTLDPQAPGFQTLDSASTKTPESKNLPLFDWRNEKVNAPQPLALEDAKPEVPGEPPVSSSPVEPPPTPPSSSPTTKVSRAKDFSESGEYDVQLANGVTKKIYRDPESNSWYRGFDEGEPNQHYSERFLGFNKDEAVKAIERKWGAEPPVETPTEPQTPTEKKNPNRTDISYQTEDGTNHVIRAQKSGRKYFSAAIRTEDGPWQTELVPQGKTKAEVIEKAKTLLDDKYSRTPEQVPDAQLARASAADNGIIYNGEANGLHAFTDPDTGSTFHLRSGSLDSDSVGDRLFEIRDAYSPEDKNSWDSSQDEIDKVIANAIEEAKRPRQTVTDPKDLTPTGTAKPTAADIIAGDKAQDREDLNGIETQLRAQVDLARAKGDSTGTRIAIRKLNDFLNEAKPAEQEAFRAEIERKYASSDVGAETKMQSEGKPSIGMMRSKMSNSGYVRPETLAVLAAAGIAGTIAYQKSKGDIGSTLAAGVIIAGLGFLGAKAIKDMRAAFGPEAKLAKVAVPGEKITEKLAQLAKDTAHTPGGFAIFGRGGFSAQAVRMAEGLTGWNGTPAFRDAMIRAEGFVTHILDQVSDALQAARPYRPTPGFSEASARYIRGQLVDKPTIEAAIKAGGGVDAAGWEKLDAVARKAYPEKWMVVDDPQGPVQQGKPSLTNTNTAGPGVTVYHVSNSTKARLVQMQKDALNTLANAKEDKEFMPFVLKSREAMDTLMQVVHNAVPPGETLNKIMGTMGQYATRTHALLTDPSYYPSEPEIANAMDRLATLKENRFLDKYASSTSTPGSVPIDYKGQTYFVSTAAADEWKNLHTPEALRSLVSQYIQEIKQIGAGKSSGLISKDMNQLGTSLFARRQELDEVTQALLGTHTDPKEMIQQTINKLVPTARSAHFMQDLIQMKDSRTGLQMGYRSEIEYNKAINDLKDQIRLSKDPRLTRDLTNRYQELSNYIPVSGQNPRMGIFQGSYVSRMAHDQLAGFTNPFGLLDNAIGQGLGRFSNMLKEFHTILNPITHVRNIVQTPMFLAMGGAADNPSAWKTAWEAMNNPLSPVGRRLTLNGVFEGSMVKGEFNHTLEDLLNGDADKNIWERFFSKGSSQTSFLGMIKNGEIRAAFHRAYDQPDNFVRASSYLAAEMRAAEKYGVSVDAEDPRVMAEARNFMSRRTMDFSNVPQWIKTGRQIPFVSMFLTYSHEVARIGMNIAQDALKGDLKAGATLGGLAAVPFMTQSMMENKLSPDDLKAWNMAQRTVPDYSRPRFKLPISRNKDGSFNYFDITSILPFSDYQMMVRSALNKDIGGFMDSNPFLGLDKTPFLQIAAEQITGKDLHTQRDYRNIWDRGRSIASEILPPMTPGLGYEYAKDVPEQLGGNLGVTNLRTGRTNTIEGAITRNLLGVDYTQIQPGMAVKNAVADAKQEMADERAYFRDVVVSTASPDAKKRAEARYVEAIQHITQRLQAKLQLIPQ